MCKENDSKKSISEQLMIRKTDVNNLVEISSLESFNETIEKDPKQMNLLNNFLMKDENQINQCKVEGTEGKFID